jgi:hypothetical protein
MSFHYNCLRQGIPIDFYTDGLTDNYDKIDFVNLPFKEAFKKIAHPHEIVHNLKKKFGNNLDIISVKRNRHERFISLWKHVIQMAYSANYNKTAKILEKLTLNEILFYTYDDLTSYLLNEKNSVDFFMEFFEKNNIKRNMYTEQFMDLFWCPQSQYHCHDPNIIWFDYDNLSEMEKWVSNKLNKPFVLSHHNSSKSINSKLELNEEFINKYNSIYDKFDSPKSIKTLI